MISVPDAQRPLVVALGVAAIFLSGIYIGVRLPSGGPKMDKDLQRAIGRNIAEETASLLPGGGTVVVVEPVCAQTRLRGVEAQVDSFSETLKRGGKVQVAGREKVPVPTPRIEGLLTADLYFQLVGKYPRASAIVSSRAATPSSA